MIEVKLSFNTTAEAAAFLHGLSSPTGVTMAPSATITPEKQEAARASTAAGKAQKAAEGKAPTPPAPSPAPAPVEQPEDNAKADIAPTVDYPTLQKAVFALAATDRPRVTEILKGLGVGSAKELKPEQYAKALALFTAPKVDEVA